MKYSNKLVRTGNSTSVTIPRALMEWLQWRSGQPIIVVANPDRTLTIRKPLVEDLDVAPSPGARMGLLPERAL